MDNSGFCYPLATVNLLKEKSYRLVMILFAFMGKWTCTAFDCFSCRYVSHLYVCETKPSLQYILLTFKFEQNHDKIDKVIKCYTYLSDNVAGLHKRPASYNLD